MCTAETRWSFARFSIIFHSVLRTHFQKNSFCVRNKLSLLANIIITVSESLYDAFFSFSTRETSDDPKPSIP